MENMEEVKIKVFNKTNKDLDLKWIETNQMTITGFPKNLLKLSEVEGTAVFDGQDGDFSQCFGKILYQNGEKLEKFKIVFHYKNADIVTRILNSSPNGLVDLTNKEEISIEVLY